MPPYIRFAAAFVLFLPGCGSATAGTGASSSVTKSSVRSRSASVLTAEEMKAGQYPNAYAAIDALHSNWLKPKENEKGFTGSTPHIPVFELNRQSDLGFEYLQNLSADRFSKIVWLSGIDAASQYGADHLWGAIVVYLK